MVRHAIAEVLLTICESKFNLYLEIIQLSSLCSLHVDGIVVIRYTL